MSRIALLVALSLAATSSCGPPPSPVPALHRSAADTCLPNDSATPPDCASTHNCGDMATFGSRCVSGKCLFDQCAADTDCAGGGVCSCKGSTFGWAHSTYGNTCVPANCRVDADCGGDGYCSPTVSSMCGSFYGVQGFYCHRPGDACFNDSDCTSSPAGYCAFDPAVGKWSCGYQHCAG